MIFNTKENCRKAFKIYQNYGFEVLLEESWRHIIRNSQTIEKIAGPEFIEKIAAYPQLRYWPQIKNPRTFNEKIMNRKLHTDCDLFTIVSDKYAVRNFVADKGLDDILNEIYLITNSPNEITLSELPDKFVMKGTHGGGSNYVKIVMEEDTVDEKDLRKAAKSWLSDTFGAIENEYWYEEIEPQFMIEEFVEPESGKVPTDYKFFVFNGRVELIEVDQGRFERHHRVMYDRNWVKQEFKYGFPIGEGVEEPSDLDEMITIAEELGADFGFVRVDLYNPQPNKIRFGEMTLAPESGEKRFEPVEYDYKLGRMWEKQQKSTATHTR